MSKKMLFVYNPTAGKSKVVGKLNEILTHFTKSGYDVTVHPTLESRDGSEYVRKHACDYDMVVCSGGDGTLNEIVSGYISGGGTAPLGYIPSGSANDTARTLNISLEPELAAGTVTGGTPFPFDIGSFNDRHFVYVAAFGAFCDISYSTPQNMKNTLGHMAYVIEGIKSISRIQPYNVRMEADHGVVEGNFLFGAVCNTLSIGGGVLKFNEGPDTLNDGKFEVLLIKDSKNIVDLGRIAHSLLANDFSDENIVFLRTSHLTITMNSEVPWTFDGEYGGEHARADITCLQRPIHIMSGLAPVKDDVALFHND